LRILDIGVATAYAILCISVISVMSPSDAASSAARNSADVRAGQFLYGYVDSVGVIFLANSSAMQICNSLHQESNGTAVLGGVIEGDACGDQPSHFVGESSATFTIAGRQETIESWIVTA
jgi:hypothetical protein